MTTADLKAKLETIDEFDWEEFNKPLSQVDMSKVVQSVKEHELGGKWKQPVSKGIKGQKQAISKYSLDKSNVLGIGSGRSSNVLLIRGLKSKFAAHPYKFGDVD